MLEFWLNLGSMHFMGLILTSHEINSPWLSRLARKTNVLFAAQTHLGGLGWVRWQGVWGEPKVSTSHYGTWSCLVGSAEQRQVNYLSCPSCFTKNCHSLTSWEAKLGRARKLLLCRSWKFRDTKVELLDTRMCRRESWTPLLLDTSVLANGKAKE